MTKRELIELLEMSDIEDIDEILFLFHGDRVEVLRPVAIDPKTNFITVESL